MHKYWPLFLITLIAGVFIFWNLSGTPISPNWDEVSHGYNAYSLLKTGKDEWGVSFPLIFRAFGDYKLPVYAYLTVIPVAIFGLNTFAVRFISALAGSLAIPGIFLLFSVLWPDKRLNFGKHKINLAFFAAILLAISPWHFFISRPALEANLALTLIIYGSYFLISGLKKNHFYIPASILLGLSLHTYNTARVFVPLLLILFLIIYRPKIKLNKFNNLSILIMFILSGLVAWQVFSGEGTARYSKLKILTENAIFQIGESRQKSKLPPIVSKLINNRPVYFTTTVLKNYISYFSPQFIYQSSGSQTQFAIPGKNLFTLPVTILFISGLFYLIIKERKEKSAQFIFSWLLLSPIAASLTADPPQALRPNPLIPAVIIISVFGILFLTLKMVGIIKSFTIVVILFSCSLAFATYINSYFNEYKTTYASSWQYGYQEAINYVNEYGSKYSKIFITKAAGEPHVFYAFYSQLNPTKIQPGANNIRFNQSDWYWTDKIDNVYFINDWNIPSTKEAKTLKLESGSEIPTNNSLLITTLFRIPKNAKLIKMVTNPDGTAAFVITSIP